MIHVLGLGDNVVDKYLHTATMYPGGNALNFAVYASMLGFPSAYLGVFGDDEAAEHVSATARSLGIDLSHCRYRKGENGYARVELVEGDRVFLGGNQGGVAREQPLRLTRLDYGYLRQFAIIHTSVYSYIEGQLAGLRESGAFVSMDFSDRLDGAYFARTVPYLDCACLSFGDMPLPEINTWVDELQGLGCKMVIATRGSKGALVAVGGKRYEQSPCLVQAKDTMGAGDSFITAFLTGYVNDMACARDFPAAAGGRGLTSAGAYRDAVIQCNLYRAAVFSAENCGRDGSFGFGRAFNRGEGQA